MHYDEVHIAVESKGFYKNLNKTVALTPKILIEEITQVEESNLPGEIYVSNKAHIVMEGEELEGYEDLRPNPAGQAV